MKKIFYPLFVFVFVFASCADMLDMGNEDVMYADKNHLTEGNDTVNSFVGILGQLQKIAVRTNLFGELRGDLVVVNTNADADLKEIANFAVSDSNAYNAPRDYYAVINNCNYYLANADTSLIESRYGVNNRYDFRVFQAEYVAVRAIRAWVYLQLGQIYGKNIPLVTEPILSLEAADTQLANAPKKDLAGICSYFIDDLLPYVAWFAYPFHGNPSQAGYNSNTPSRLSVLPIDLVLGDLYLWRASINNDPVDAKTAAKHYYDYIDWVPTDGGVANNNSYKIRCTIGTGKCAWDAKCFTTGNFHSMTSSHIGWFRTTSFGTASAENISVIAMDSASSQNGYNALRRLYNYDMDQEDVEASFSPSKPCYAYSDNAVYFERVTTGTTTKNSTVSAGNLTEEQVEQHFVGDMRIPTGLHESQRGDHTYTSQLIEKTYYPQDVIIYRIGDVYLRLAEALNYAGYPKFALAILTSGVDNKVIENEVLQYCNTATDSNFVKYFDFPTTYYQTRIGGYGQMTEKGKEFLMYPANIYDSNNQSVKQIGIHARGCGVGIRDAEAIQRSLYYNTSADIPADTTGYPVDSSAWSDFKALAAEQYNIKEPLEDTCASHRKYLEYMEQYRNDTIALKNNLRTKYLANCIEWYRVSGMPQVISIQQAAVDSLIDAEQALETCFEGFRFGSLMRAAYRKKSSDPTYLAKKVAQRDPSLSGVLANPENWFIRWNGQIGR